MNQVGAPFYTLFLNNNQKPCTKKPQRKREGKNGQTVDDQSTDICLIFGKAQELSSKLKDTQWEKAPPVCFKC